MDLVLPALPLSVSRPSDPIFLPIFFQMQLERDIVRYPKGKWHHRGKQYRPMKQVTPVAIQVARMPSVYAFALALERDLLPSGAGQGGVVKSA